MAPSQPLGSESISLQTDCGESEKYVQVKQLIFNKPTFIQSISMRLEINTLFTFFISFSVSI